MSSNVIANIHKESRLTCKCGRDNPIRNKGYRTTYTCECGYSALIFSDNYDAKDILAGYTKVKNEQ